MAALLLAVAAAPFYTLSQLNTIVSQCSQLIGFGVNIGSNNPSYDIHTDYVSFNGTTYNFELYEVATTKEGCKNGGWMNLKRTDGSSFKNQGDCIQFVNTGK